MLGANLRPKIKNYDFIMAGAVIFLTLLGWIVIASATFTPGQHFLLSSKALNQLIFGLIGLVAMLFFTVIDYRLLKPLVYYFYGLVILLLILVLISGKIIHGASRWISLGFFDLQPSELAKLALILVLAHYFSTQNMAENPLRHLLFTFLLAAGPSGLVILQPDLGSALVLMAIWLGMIFASSIKKVYLYLFILIGLVLLPFGWLFLRDYQRKRILTFLNPQTDPLGEGYNVIQAKIAVGSGQIFGRGLGHGPQSQLNYLPSQHTDFIFAALAEELGFLGVLLLLVLFFIFILRGLRAAWLSRDSFGSLVAVGIVVMVLFQILVNVGMNLGIMPVTGIPLPWVSYGGSSLIICFIAVGILESILLRHRQIAF